MNAKEYLSQSYRLDNMISSNLKEIERLKDMAESVSGVSLDNDFVQTSKNIEPYFVNCLSKIDFLKHSIDEEVSLLIELKKQIRDTILQLGNADERMVLMYRYIDNLTWEKIAEEMDADPKTVWRWHKSALDHIVVPKNPIAIRHMTETPI